MAVPVQPATLVAVAQHQRVRVATKADLLLVLDDSRSMAGKQNRLAQAFAAFTKDLDSLNPPVDYQVGVVSTSVQERFGACGPASDPAAAEQCDSDWGAEGFSCDAGLACLRTFPDRAGKLLSAPGITPVLRRDDMTADQFAQKLAQNVAAVGTTGARQPQGFEAMAKVLAAPNAGLFRDGAKVVVAFISDAEDCSDPAGHFAALVKDDKGNLVDRCAQESAGESKGPASLEPVSHYVSLLRGLKNADGSSKEVEVAAFTSLTNGGQDPGLCANASCDAACDSSSQATMCAQSCQASPTPGICQTDCVNECHQFCGGQVPSRRYVEMADAFSGIAANICADDASGPLSRLSRVIGIPTEIVLTSPPQDPALLLVQVLRGKDKIACDPGKGYHLVQTPDGQAVHFDGPCVLQPDDVWDIRYLASR